jgi:PAS domain S-box-containing protein
MYPNRCSFNDPIRSLRKLPGKLFNTRVRLAIGLSVTVLSLVLIAQVLELIPNSNKTAIQARKMQTETLALAGNAIYESTGNRRAFEQTLKHTLNRTPELRSIGLRDNRDLLMININDHDRHWEQPPGNRSNDRYMFVPIYQGSRKIGQLELSYEPLLGVKSWLASDVAKLAIFMLVTSFAAFNLLLWRILRQLDPRGAVPQRLREALDILAEGLLVVDRRGAISLANGTFGELVGEDADSLMGKSANDFPWQIERVPWLRAMEEQRTVKDHNVRIKDTQGVTRTFNVSASPVLGKQNRCRGAMVTFDDITILEEHKQELIKARKAADAANEAKSVFLSRMSHEIRTPMNAIIGYTDILQRGEADVEPRQRYLGTIHSSGEHLLTLINDILDLSKIEAGQMTVEKRPCELLVLMTQVIDTLRIRADQAGLSLNLKIEGEVPKVIRTDETRLRQVLINTIGNAIKFTREGGVAVFVRMSGDRRLLEFDVLDTGVGIPRMHWTGSFALSPRPTIR